MNTIQYLLIGLVALIHIYILVLEMFFWTTPKGIKAFDLKNKEFANDTKVLAANQGLYNGFLAGGLIWSMALKNIDTTIFFLSCIIIAGIYGAYSTTKIKIFIIQSVPALIGLLFLIM